MDPTPFAEAYQELNHRFIKLVSDLSALRGLSRLSMRRTSQDELLRDAMRVLMENSDFERCSVFLLEDDTLMCAGGLDWPDLLNSDEAGGRRPKRFQLGEGIIGMAAETGNLQHCRDSRHEPRFLQLPQGNHIGSLICVPILFADKVIGVVNVSHQRNDAFNEAHERLLAVFASFLGQIISNWRYYHQMEEEIQRRTQELEAALQEAEELKRRYQHLSIVDELTGIHNRRFFFPEAHAALASAVRHRQAFSILMVDLDHFKQINDVHGHGMGDKVLQITAALLKGQTREGDIIARFGGEEFVLALPHTDLDGARQLADRVLVSLRSLAFNASGKTLRVTTSIGISGLTGQESPDRPDLLESLLRQADQALYHSKAHGRDQSRAFADIDLRLS
ncbi:MAG TPA: sensor domain-containing diguanylate cyclase [Gammaproteobacteria bacterium]